VDFDFLPREWAFREEVRAWLAAHLPAELAGRGFAGVRPDIPASLRAQREAIARLKDSRESGERAG